MAALTLPVTDVELVRGNLAEIRANIAAAARRAGRGDGGEVRVLAATKYVPSAHMPVLARAGVRVVGENRAQDLVAKVAHHGDLFEWHFIGALQSRRVRAILPHVTLIHSLASTSALDQIARHRHLAKPGTKLLVEVNVAGEHAKAGIPPRDLATYLQDPPLPVVGLTAMVPRTEDPESSRPWFAALRELAREHDLGVLSMGTSQDYTVAVEEGATIVRIGASLYA